MEKIKSLYRTFVLKWEKLLDRFQVFGPASPIIFLVVLALFLFFTSRLILNIVYLDRVLEEPEFYFMYLLGIRMDLIVICYYISLPALFFFALPKKVNSYLTYFW